MIKIWRRFYSDSVKYTPRFTSSVKAGTKLKGVNVRKAGEDPVAMADNEYPEWLWDLLDAEAQAEKLAADPIKAAKKARREANRKKIREHNFLAKMG